MVKKRIKSRFEREFDEKMFRVTIFGSARVKKGDPTYKMVSELAEKIGGANMDIVTGGGPGLMTAASEGHRKGSKGKNKAHSVGLLIKLPMEEKQYKHINIKHEFHRFSERLDTFMTLSNAVVVAPGGLGTLLEFFYTWQLIQVKQICDIPIIMLGDSWGSLIKWVKKGPLRHQFMNQNDFRCIFVARNPTEAFNILKEAHTLFQKGGDKVCLNMTKYRVR